MAKGEDDIRKYWDIIPHRTDILITHGPAYGVLDCTIGGDNAGCKELLSVVKRVKPKYHLFGHIHGGYGTLKAGKTVFVNGSSLDENYLVAHAPIIIEI